MKKTKYQNYQTILCIIFDFLYAFTISNNPDEILTLKGSLLFIPIILWTLLIVFFGMETKFKNAFIRMIYLIIGTVFALLMISNLEQVAITLMYFAIGYTILMIVVVLKPKKEKNGKVKMLPIGQFSKKHHKIFNLILVVAVLLAFSLTFIFSYFIEMKSIYSFLIPFVIVFSLSILSNPLNRAILKFNKDINFNEFENAMLQLISEETIHYDSRNFLRLSYVNYLYLYDQESAISYFEKIKVPYYKSYKIHYDLIDIINSINKNEKEESNEKFELFKSRYPKNKQINNLKRTLIVYFTLDEIPDIKELYPINKGSNIHRLINAHLLMVYYKTRNNIVEAKEFAKYILLHGNDLKEIIKEAQEVIDLN